MLNEFPNHKILSRIIIFINSMERFFIHDSSIHKCNFINRNPNSKQKIPYFSSHLSIYHGN